MDDKYVDEWGDFSVAKIMLSNALPSSVYDLRKDKALGGVPERRSTPGQARRGGEDAR